MLSYEPPINPPCDYWHEYGKPKFIEETLKDVSENIHRFPVIYDMLYEYIEDNLELFLPEKVYE